LDTLVEIASELPFYGARMTGGGSGLHREPRRESKADQFREQSMPGIAQPQESMLTSISAALRLAQPDFLSSPKKNIKKDHIPSLRKHLAAAFLKPHSCQRI